MTPHGEKRVSENLHELFLQEVKLGGKTRLLTVYLQSIERQANSAAMTENYSAEGRVERQGEASVFSGLRSCLIPETPLGLFRRRQLRHGLHDYSSLCKRFEVTHVVRVEVACTMGNCSRDDFQVCLEACRGVPPFLTAFTDLKTLPCERLG